MAPGNLSLDSTLEAFRENQAKLVKSGWKKDDGKWNLERVAEPAMRALRAAGVPEPTLKVADGEVSTGLGAVFEVSTWTITGARALYLRGDQAQYVDDAEMQRLAAAMYHEARHAEQFFLAAIVIARKWKWSREATEQVLQGDLPQAVRDAASKTTVAPAAEDRADIAGWIDAYATVRQTMATLSEARTTLVDLGNEVLDDQVSLTSVRFSSEDECDRYTKMLEDYAPLAASYKKRYEDALAAYVGQAHEVDAYTVAGKVGGTRPDAATLYRNTVGTKLGGLSAIIDGRIREYKGVTA